MEGEGGGTQKIVFYAFFLGLVDPEFFRAIIVTKAAGHIASLIAFM